MRTLLYAFLAVAIGGINRKSVRSAREAYASIGSPALAATVLGASFRLGAEDAALVNGIAARGLELDDTFEKAALHPGVVVFPALLAVAEEDGTELGRVLEAAVVGYDVMCHVGVVLGATQSYGPGFHPTGVAGAIGAAAAVARLRGLDEKRTTNAIGVAADLAAGSLECLSDGTWTKRLNAGHAAAVGIRSARLAGAGFIAPQAAIEMPNGRSAPHGVILKIVATNICGSDLHIYRGSFPVPQGMVMGHEMTGEVVEVGPDVEFLSEGDLVSVPFNVACGRCRNCRARHTEVCETVNPDAACGAYGFNLGDWQGGQAEYLFVPYADFQLLRFPDKDQAMEKIRDLALLSDILPTAFHGLMEAGAKPGSTVYNAGAGPVGRCGAAAARLLGASCIIVGDYHQDRLDLVKNNGCETIDLKQDVPLTDQIEAILGEPMVDCAVDYVGNEAHGIGREAEDMSPAHAINQVMDATRAGGATGIVGVYGPDPLASSKAEQEGTYPLDFGKAWIKSPRISGGQAPIMHYNRELMMSILWDRMPYLSDMLNTQVISLDEAPDAYAKFDAGVSEKFIIDPHGMIPA